MTDTPSETPNTEPQTEQPRAPNTINEVTPEQWQAFVGALSEQNNALQAAVAQKDSTLREISVREQQSRIAEMTDKERADAYEAQINQLRAVGQQAQAQDVSNTVWQTRDADAARRILQSHDLTGNEPELYRAAWDVNWMPRFAASVDAIVRSKKAQQKANPSAADNPANRANVGTGSPVPEIDLNTTSGFDTIRYALGRGKG